MPEKPIDLCMRRRSILPINRISRSRFNIDEPPFSRRKMRQLWRGVEEMMPLPASVKCRLAAAARLPL